MIQAAKREQVKAVTKNSCSLCSPLGASVVFRGLEGTIPLIHGSQGCATYIRRYLISHFKEPMDIASSSFSEDSAIFGGGDNLKRAIDNVRTQYNPQVIGIATTCLSETIGDNLSMILAEYASEHRDEKLPDIIAVSTPSYAGTHVSGFHEAVRGVVAYYGLVGERKRRLNIFPGFVSPADLRYIKRVVEDFDIPLTLFPDYSDSLDGGLWGSYQSIPAGGAAPQNVADAGLSEASIEFTPSVDNKKSAGFLLEEMNGVKNIRMQLPIGISNTDRFMETMKFVSGNSIPENYLRQRDRLIDAYADAHKYIFGQRVAVVGDEDLVSSLTGFLAEIGMDPVLCASGGRSGKMKSNITDVLEEYPSLQPCVLDKADFEDIEEAVTELKPDMVLCNSKAYKFSRNLDIPLLRVGFPIHDRVGGARIQHLGYDGTQMLFDRICNTILERKQALSPVGYSYL